MLMKNEIEQKKEYVTPVMEVYQFQPQNHLLECTTLEDPNCKNPPWGIDI